MKVILTREQAKALEVARKKVTDEDIVRWHVDHIWTDDEKPLRALSLNALCSALYVGFDVEPSPEEKISKIYKEAQFFYKKYISESSGSFHAGQLEGIKITLDLFNIKITGVNC
ncbi:MAG: hypothetical protein K0Q87_99 [Neobacillus sp.]|nr:hypothetical protein [Neobacillus sp.]